VTDPPATRGADERPGGDADIPPYPFSPRRDVSVLDLGRVGSAAVTFVLGLVVGLVGTIAHRGTPPWGLVLAVGATLSAAVLARGLGGGPALATYGAGLLTIVQLANAVRPGGDVLVAGDALGYTWLALPVIMCAVVAFLPHRWFARAPGAS
jgi:hypothetical protein